MVDIFEHATPELLAWRTDVSHWNNRRPERHAAREALLGKDYERVCNADECEKLGELQPLSAFTLDSKYLCDMSRHCKLCTARYGRNNEAKKKAKAEEAARLEAEKLVQQKLLQNELITGKDLERMAYLTGHPVAECPWGGWVMTYYQDWYAQHGDQVCQPVDAKQADMLAEQARLIETLRLEKGNLQGQLDTAHRKEQDQLDQRVNQANELRNVKKHKRELAVTLKARDTTLEELRGSHAALAGSHAALTQAVDDAGVGAAVVAAIQRRANGEV